MTIAQKFSISINAGQTSQLYAQCFIVSRQKKGEEEGKQSHRNPDQKN